MKTTLLKHSVILFSVLLTIYPSVLKSQDGSNSSPMPEPEGEIAEDPNTQEIDRKSKLRSLSTLRKGEKESEINGFYVGAFAAFQFAGSSDVDYESFIVDAGTGLGASSGFSGEGEIDFGPGGGLKIGYAKYSDEKSLEEFQIVPAIELEASHLFINSTLDGSTSGAGTDVDLDLAVTTITANAVVRFHNRILTPYAGLGGGMAFVQIDDASGRVVTTGGTGQVVSGLSGEDDQFTPVIQGIFGLERVIYHPNLSIYFEYKSIFLPDVDLGLRFSNVNSTTSFQMNNQLIHSGQVGLRWHF